MMQPQQGDRLGPRTIFCCCRERFKKIRKIFVWRTPIHPAVKTNFKLVQSVRDRGGRYYRKKLSIADKSAFFKLSANYRYRKKNIWELSKNYRYRKMCIQFHPINSIESTVPKTRKRPQRSTEETKKRPIIFIKRPKKA